MKTAFRLWLFFVFACGALSTDMRNEPRDVSIIRLIAAPRDYALKVVRVVGYLNIAFEGDAIYLHEEDYRRSLTTNALAILANPDLRTKLEKLTNQYVIIEGVFDPSVHGHMGLFSGSIGGISRADAWKPGPVPTVGQ